jgi:hypothetical protein
VKGFASNKEFVKEFYPKQEQQQAQQTAETKGDFGSELAFDSLNKPAGLLKFGGHLYWSSWSTIAVNFRAKKQIPPCAFSYGLV